GESALARKPGPERFTFHVRHHIVQRIVLRTRVVQRKHVRVRESRCDFYLAQKAHCADGLGKISVKDLDRNLAMVLEVFREIHRRHATRTKLALDTVSISNCRCEAS